MSRTYVIRAVHPTGAGACGTVRQNAAAAFCLTRFPCGKMLLPGHGVAAATASGACTLTYLEINGWLLSTSGVTVLVDPVLEGELDFGIPGIYSASKRVLPST
eukprot:7369319-Prymnesium_polylepis.1